MKVFYLLALIFCVSCSKNIKQDDHLVFKSANQIDYYRLSVSDKDLSNIFKRENLSRHDRRLAEILHHDEPTTIADSLFISEMEQTSYFTKTRIDKNLNTKILETFAPSETMLASFAPIEPLCAPTYRDILVFRDNSKITGFAKVCFECSQTHVVGEQSEGVEIDYRTLNKILTELDGI